MPVQEIEGAVVIGTGKQNGNKKNSVANCNPL